MVCFLAVDAYRVPKLRYQGWGLGEEARGEICTGDGCEGGVEERYGGVDEERVA